MTFAFSAASFFAFARCILLGTIVSFPTFSLFHNNEQERTRTPMITTIFPFGGSAPLTKSDDLDRQIVGGKGLGLQVMGAIGIDIPPGTDRFLVLCDP